MKLNKFNELCQKKWEGHGDVQELHLREESYDELWCDILVDGARPVSILNPTAVLNPVTRSEVRIRITKADKDFILVHQRGKRHPVRDDVDGL